MNIVILDGYTTNPGDISWGAFEQLGDLTVYDYTAEEEICERVKDADIIISNKTVFSRETLKKITRAKYIGPYINRLQCSRRTSGGRLRYNGYKCSGIQHRCGCSAYLCAVTRNDKCRRTPNSAVHAGEWSDDRRFCFWRSPLHELAGKNTRYNRIRQHRL